MIQAYFQILSYLLQCTETKKKIMIKLIEIRTGYLQNKRLGFYTYKNSISNWLSITVLKPLFDGKDTYATGLNSLTSVLCR